MKKIITLLIITVLFTFQSNAQQRQRTIAECTIDYNITLDDVTGLDNATVEMFKSTIKTVYIKGNQSRVDFISPSFIQSVIYDKRTGNAVILREIGGNKFLTKLDKAAWDKSNNKFENLKTNLLDETKVILGYECKKAVLLLTDGTTLDLFYATNYIPSVKEFEYQFKDVPGFVLEYESQDKSGKKIKYTATKINLNPIATSKFDIPTTGYRLLNE